VTLEQLWTAQTHAPVQPRLLESLTGLDEALLRTYRRAPIWVVGWYLSLNTQKRPGADGVKAAS
jgi:hypothetical protein